MTAVPLVVPAGEPAETLLSRMNGLLDQLAVALELAPSSAAGGLLRELTRVATRTEALRLRVIAAADTDRLAHRAGHTGTDAWVAQQTFTDARAAYGQVRLATELADGLPATGEALSDGRVGVGQARVIAQAVRQLPDGLDPGQRAAVEEHLLAQAQSMSPGRLARAARRALEAVTDDPDQVDAHHDWLLRDREAAAAAKTRLVLRQNGDGTTSGEFTVPDLAAAILRTVVQSMTAPRRHAAANRTPNGTVDGPAGGQPGRGDWAHQHGLAFTQLLERLPTDHLHHAVAATVVLTIDEASLRQRVAAAGLDTGDELSAGQARQIACGAGLLPAVLGGASVPVDLGRRARLFSDTQRLALATQWDSCAADGCDRPFAWTELHHRTPWSHGGRTDLADAVPLCGFHHRRIHDPAFEHRYLPNRKVAFHLRM